MVLTFNDKELFYKPFFAPLTDKHRKFFGQNGKTGKSNYYIYTTNNATSNTFQWYWTNRLPYGAIKGQLVVQFQL